MFISTSNSYCHENVFSFKDLLLSQMVQKKFDTGQFPKEEITKAETLLFLNNHLKKIKSSKKFTYLIRTSGSLAKKNKDFINVFLTFDKNMSSVKAELESGKTTSYLNPIKSPESNPIILYFLERDILEMKKLTGGQPNYFRKRIRTALAEGPIVKKIKIKYNSKKIDALSFSIKPYATDPLRNTAGRSKYKKFSKKKYTFVLSKNVPGEIYSITANIPSKIKENSLIVDELILIKTEGL
ncbi:MAG: hypothetical protein CBD16_00590 [Betaproteobacteria bacterium TMED156]|nr:MAG: hypothetical protein CBD16_00590 [Betaproteobacteria bacterium TMED156]